MELYSPIRGWSDLPAGRPSDIPESPTLDFKAKHAPDPAEHAKDIAAFANACGGVILVGVAENSDSFERALLPLPEAKRAARDYEDAARNLLAPRPQVDPVVIAAPGTPERGIVAVNVDPFPGQLVAAKIPRSEAWRYPVRTAARHCSYLDPEKAMIYSDPRSRKAAILLASIPGPDRKHLQLQVTERNDVDGVPSVEVHLRGELVAVDPMRNSVAFRATLRDQSEIVSFGVPLEDVEATWYDASQWIVRLAGTLILRRGEHHYRVARYLSGREPR